MRRVRTGLAVAVMIGLASACGGSEGGEGSAPAPGARSCSAWAGQMDDGERWSAAEELLVNAKGSDGTEGDLVPSTATVRQFAVDLSALCEQKPGDELLAVVADELYARNSGSYIG